MDLLWFVNLVTKVDKVMCWLAYLLLAAGVLVWASWLTYVWLRLAGLA